MNKFLCIRTCPDLEVACLELLNVELSERFAALPTMLLPSGPFHGVGTCSSPSRHLKRTCSAGLGISLGSTTTFSIVVSIPRSSNKSFAKDKTVSKGHAPHPDKKT